MEFTHFIGIDLGKAELHAATLDAAGKACAAPEVHPHTAAGISRLAGAMARLGDPAGVLVVLEDTGRLCERLVAALHAEGFFVWVVPPAALSRGTLGMNRLKDDPYDARQLALVAMTHRRQARRWEPADPDIDRLGRLFAYRRQLVRDRTRLKNRRTSEMDGLRPMDVAIRGYGEQLALLDRQIAGVEAEARALIKANKGIRRMHRILTSIPGVGTQTATRVIAMTGGFKRVASAKALAAFICSAPYAKASGTSGRKSRKVSRKGDRRTKALFCCGIVSTATRARGFWREDYRRMIDSGRHHNSAVNALINKVIRLIYTLVNTDQVFDRKKYLENKRSALDKPLHAS